MSSNSSSMPRLGPAWRSSGAGGSGRGFQPPPAVPDETRDRSGSHASGGSGADKNRNPFSLLDDEDDGGAPSSNSSSAVDKNNRVGSSSNRGPPAPTNDRFSALKSSESSRPYIRSASSGPRPGGRSLADLAAGLSSSGGDRDHHHQYRGHERNDSKPITRSSSTGYHHSRGERGGTSSDIQRSRSGSGGGGASLDYDDGGAKIIRFTREKLLSLRPRPTGDGLPDVLKHLEGSVVISNEPQDPVCWDTFDADEIWSQVARERRTSERPPPPKDESRRGSRLGDDEPRVGRERRGTGFSTGGGGGRWQRGMSIPESDRGSRPSRNDIEADNPDDLWDDPTTSGGAMAAAADFSAFGGSLEDDHPRGRTGMDAFELTDMSKAAAAFEAELDDDKKDDNGNDSEADDHHNHTVDSSRPLAGTGTTIRSGSGNDVSVFEDFDEPSADDGEVAPIKSGNEANAASSRLMQMIGVSGTGEASSGAAAEETKPETSTDEKNEAISNNPWGAPAVSSNPWGEAGGLGAFGSQANETDRLSAQQQEEELRRRQKEEEKKRWEAMQAKQQADLQAQQQQLRQQQQDQVENVLMERVSNILENSWGKSDLNSILSTLHAEDSRVIAILSSIDQLRALISRHPQRIQLGAEGGVIMAQLRLNNQQWQVAQAQIAQAKAAQEQQELQRRRLQEEQIRQQQVAQQEALARAQALEQERQKQQVKIIPNAPWFYADPQGNIQGPFAGDEMKQWLEAGYFKGDLPISQSNGGPFRPLASYFTDPKTAFQSDQSSEEKAAAEARAQAEAEAAARVEAAKEAEKKRREEEQAKLAEEERRKAAEAELQQQANQSAQLKMMLGLGGGSTGGIAGPPEPEPEPVPEPAAVEQPTKKQQKKKVQQKQAQQQQPVEEKKIAPSPEPAAPPAPAWGGGAAPASRKKSMSEIQQEEAKEAARRAKEQGGRPSGGGWANVAATGGSTAWGGAAATAPVVSSIPVIAGVSSTQKINANAAWNMKQAAAASAPTPAAKQAQKAAAVDNFGANGQMTPTMEKWCKDQMQKLNGSDDLTLVTFCMTLTDSDEIRQYLSAYLGSTPQVNNFATEFIKRKGGDNSSEWESAGGPKKGRKKKGGK